MKTPTISQARAICEALKVRGVIVIALSEDNIAGASYGETKLECKQTAFAMDLIIKSLETGAIPVWNVWSEM